MAKPIVMQYAAPYEHALQSLAAVIARLGYTINGIDNQNGLVTFESGMSRMSWAGQRLSAHVLPVGNSVQITIGGSLKAHGAQLQITDMGEAGHIATKVFEQLNGILGGGQLISGTLRPNLPIWVSMLIVLVVIGIIIAIGAFYYQ